jgi:hypothetical protein
MIFGASLIEVVSTADHIYARNITATEIIKLTVSDMLKQINIFLNTL